MAATIANFAVSVTARTSKFNRGMDKARTKLTRFASGVSAAAKKVALFGVALATAAAVALTAMVKSSFSTIDATAKLARSLGLTTEQLIGYQHAASIAGLESADLSKAFIRMEKNISDANLGLTTAQRIFGEEAGLGLDFKKLIKLSPDKQFKTIADALSQMTVTANRTRVALDLFGRSGVKIIELMKDGSAGLVKMSREAHRLNLEFSAFDAAKIEEANDAMTSLGAAIKGATQKLAVGLSEAITKVAKKFEEFALSATADVGKVTASFEILGGIIGFINGVLQILLGVIKTIAGVAVGLVSALTAVLSVGQQVTGFTRSAQESRGTSASLKGFAKSLITEGVSDVTEIGLGASGRSLAKLFTDPAKGLSTKELRDLNKLNKGLELESALITAERAAKAASDANPRVPVSIQSGKFGSGAIELQASAGSGGSIQRLIDIAQEQSRKLSNIEENTGSNRRSSNRL